MSEGQVVSNRDYEEHLEKVLEVQKLKAHGTPDAVVCKELRIGAGTLQKYKQTLTKVNLQSLTPEYQNSMRHNIDEQVQLSIYKLSQALEKIEVEYAEQKAFAEEQLADPEIPVDTKLKLQRYNRFPVDNVLDVQKVLLNAIDLRTKVWGLDKEGNTGETPTKGKNVVFQQINTYEAPSEKLNQIADMVSGRIDGVQLREV